MSSTQISGKYDDKWLGPVFLRKNTWRLMLLEVTFQLNDIIRLHVPLSKGISTMAIDLPNEKVRDLCSVVAFDIQNGFSLHEALARRPNFFPASYVAAIRVGEETGRLEEILDRLEEHLVQTGRFHAELSGHLAYLRGIFLMIFFLSIGLIIFVLPQFVEIFESLRGVLPLVTIGIARLLNVRWFFPVLVALTLLLLCLEMKSSYFSKQQGWFSQLLRKLVAYVPILGRVYHTRDLARLAEQLEALTWTGVSLDKALDYAATSDVSPSISAALTRLSKRISNGSSLTEALKKENPSFFPERFRDLIALGEEAGTLPAMMKQLVEIYQRETLHRARMLMKLGAPLGVCCVGLYMFLIYYSFMVSVFELSSLVMHD